MSQFQKKLEWIKQSDDLDGFYAEPYGLKWRYSIITHKNKKIEFAILDHNLEYTTGYPKQCYSIAEAQANAANHYESLLKQLIA